MSKFITEQQLIGEQGVAIAKARVSSMGFLFYPTGQTEAGIDGFIEIRDPGSRQVNGKLVAAQVKTTSAGAYTAETDASFEYLCREEDIEYWRSNSLPFIVILVRLADQTAYWKHIPHLPDKNLSALDNRRLLISKDKDVFDQTAREEIAHLAIGELTPGAWLPASRTPEYLHLNMLRVRMPHTIWIAQAPYRHGRDMLKALLELTESPPFAWVARGGRVLSFLNVGEPPLSRVIDIGTAEEIETEAISQSQEESDERDFIELLGRTLRAQLDGILAYHDKYRAFYFPADSKEIDLEYGYDSLQKRTKRRVVAARRHRTEDRLIYVRHSAFSPRFWRVGQDWFVSIESTYVFTWDGKRPDRFSGERLSRLKRKETNASVFGQFIMWQSLLTGLGARRPQLEMFAPASEERNILSFESSVPLLVPVSVPEEIWRPRDVSPPPAEEDSPFAI